MKFSETQIEWLKKATAQDISRVFAKKDLDFKEKMEIQRRWLELRQDGISKEVYESGWWSK